jgi:hypothetical protein
MNEDQERDVLRLAQHQRLGLFFRRPSRPPAWIDSRQAPISADSLWAGTIKEFMAEIMRVRNALKWGAFTRD